MNEEGKIYLYLSDHILAESINANIEITDVVVYLAHYGHKIRDIANKISCDEMHFDDFAQLVDNAIDTLKKDPTIIDKWLFREASK